MKVLDIGAYKDGGTVRINTDEGLFFLDGRIGSATTGKLFDDYPKEPEAKEVVKQSTRQAVADALRTYLKANHPGAHWATNVPQAIESI